jgi:hypothetical protein
MSSGFRRKREFSESLSSPIPRQTRRLQDYLLAVPEKL